MKAEKQYILGRRFGGQQFFFLFYSYGIFLKLKRYSVVESLRSTSWYYVSQLFQENVETKQYKELSTIS